MPLNRPTPINSPSMHVGNSFRLHWIMAATFAILAEHTGKIGSATRSPIGRKTLFIPISCGVQLISFMNSATRL
jgi:hypothetical protein